MYQKGFEKVKVVPRRERYAEQICTDFLATGLKIARLNFSKTKTHYGFGAMNNGSIAATLLKFINGDRDYPGTKLPVKVHWHAEPRTSKIQLYLERTVG